MPMTLAEVYDAAMELPDEEFAKLKQLLNGPEEESTGLHPEWKDEIKRRLEEIDTGKAQLIPWEQVEAEMDVLLLDLRKRHGGS